MRKYSWILKLETQVMKVMLRKELFSNFLQNKFQKPQQISFNCVQEIMKKNLVIKVTFSIESFMTSWHKEVILPHKMEQVEKAYMDINLQMSKFGTLIHIKVYFRWQTLVQTLMDHSSSFALKTLHT